MAGQNHQFEIIILKKHRISQQRYLNQGDVEIFHESLISVKGFGVNTNVVLTTSTASETINKWYDKFLEMF